MRQAHTAILRHANSMCKPVSKLLSCDSKTDMKLLKESEQPSQAARFLYYNHG